MNCTKFFTLIFIVCSIWSCDFGTTSGSSTSGNSITDSSTKPTSTVKPKTGAMDNWTCVPRKQVGRITANFTTAELEKMFGEENVRNTDIGLGEGETAPGTIVFQDSKDELIIQWIEGEEYKKIDNIKIRGEGTNWKTSEGITVGSTLDQLLELNGKDFSFTGFEWDYAGGVMSWEDGKINADLKVYLEPTNQEAIFPDLVGDKIFSTSHEKAKAAGLKVASFTINF